MPGGKYKTEAGDIPHRSALPPVIPETACTRVHSAVIAVTLIEAINNAEKKLAAGGVSNARRDAEVLLCRAIKKDRAWLLAHIREEVETGPMTVFEESIARRTRREPLQYITGVQEFWGLEFAVNPSVLIPRPETELIVEAALGSIPDRSADIRLIDLCTGSGCIAVSLARELGRAQFFATDTSPDALKTARANAQRHGVADRIRFFEGNLFDPLGELDIAGQIDMIVANPPYVSLADRPSLQAEVRDYEPHQALFAGPKGTEIEEQIFREAPPYLKSTGMLIMEIGVGQARLLVELLQQDRHFRSCSVLKDLAGIDRVIVASRQEQARKRTCSCTIPKL